MCTRSDAVEKQPGEVFIGARLSAGHRGREGMIRICCKLLVLEVSIRWFFLISAHQNADVHEVTPLTDVHHVTVERSAKTRHVETVRFWIRI